MAPRGTDFKLETYTRLTTITKSRFTSVKKIIEELITSEPTLSLFHNNTLSTYRSEVQRKKDDFDSNFQRVLNLDLDDEGIIDSLVSDQEEINDLYIHIISRIDSVVQVSNSQSTHSDSSDRNSSGNCSSTVRLPKFDLPKFSGDLSQWTSFINLFNSAIHNNDTLTNVMRFQYLLSVLEKEPLHLVRGLTLTDSNYKVAYDLLHKRYHNDRRLQLLHLNQLLDLPNVTAFNIQGVRQFVNLFAENTQALNALNYDVQTSNSLLVAILLRKMDVDLRRKLESFRSINHDSKHSLPTSHQIIDFLTAECDHLEDAMLSQRTHVKEVPVSPSTSRVKASNQYKTLPKKNVTMVATQSNSHPAKNFHSLHCFICNETSHKVYHCPVFLKHTPQERFQLVKNHHHCISCLGEHDTKLCKSLSMCKCCNKRHNTLLHFTSDQTDLSPNRITENGKAETKTSHNQPNKPQTNNTSVTLTSHHHLSNPNTNTTVLLGTLLVQVESPHGTRHILRAIADSGSMCNLISERAANLLNVKRQKSDIQLSGINQHVTHNKGQIIIDVKTLSGQTVIKAQPTLILDKLTVDLPRVPIALETLQLTRSLELADPTFHRPGRIDLVLGGAIFPHIFTNDKVSLGSNMPYALGSHFGYIMMGTAPCLPSEPTTEEHNVISNLNVCMHTSSDSDLHMAIQRFWVQEELPVVNTKSNEEILCDQHFVETHTRDPDGRYIVRLPFKEPVTNLGESKHSAELRIKAVERKFNQNKAFSQLYHDFMDEYLSLGHMSQVQCFDSTQPHYFLPHHGVIKESSSTTKLRTVFDASCKTSSGKSINDILLSGPKLQNNICDLLLQFRRHNIVFCCDIRQMYRQIVVHPNDRNFQLILWRNNPQESMVTYQLNTVTYGMNTSPFLAIRTLHQLAEDEGKDFPDAAYALRHHTYVDDIITGASTTQEAVALQTQLINLLDRGCFELRKWVSNSPDLLDMIPQTHLETPHFLQDSESPQFRVLGLQWSPTDDVFSYNISTSIDMDKVPTKRKVLSTIAQIFDPCGFLVPFIMLAKCFMQLIWSRGLSWDSHLPADLLTQWNAFTSDLSQISKISIPRPLNLTSTCNVELHGFCDASEVGYAAVIYFRCEFNDRPTIVKLITAKSRVAPLKKITIPRLELCASHLLSQMVTHIKSIFQNTFSAHNIKLWCDSTVALTWIQTPSYRLKTFIANRVAQIQEMTPTEAWHHIRSEDNPADCASRGIRISTLITQSSWWNGPSWLCLPASEWPQYQFHPIKLDNSHELKPNHAPVLITTEQPEWSLLTKFSSWIKLQRVTAFILRFIYNCRNTTRKRGFLSIQELNDAQNKIFSLVQTKVMASEIASLSKHEICSKHIQRLKPFLDSNNLIRVGGRLTNASIPYDSRHPILLPKKHHVINILIDHYHVHYLHAGPQFVQSVLSQFVWILCSRSIIRSRIFKCITCYKSRPKITTPLMGDLPSSRIMPSKPFSSTGMDYAGPYILKTSGLRFSKQIKVYICVFICMVTKAVHVEVVDDLTTAAFLAALTRFISRRGSCNNLYSDCGTTFVGAHNELRSIVHTIIRNTDSQESISRFASIHQIKFHFNPPAAPHQGGLWESAIKRIKFHLQRVIGSVVLTYPEFVTLTIRIEAILNSRPLTPLSSDPSDLCALTPGHFLTGAPLASLPESDLTNIPVNRLKHWQMISAFYQNIWKRWSAEYLHTMQQRVKWTKSCKNVKVGDLVLINSPSPPLQWPLARITALFPGRDGIVRVAEVRTANGILVRPVTKLCVLPLD